MIIKLNHPLFRKVEIHNLKRGNNKLVKVLINIRPDAVDRIYMKQSGGTEVIAYKDPKTNLFVYEGNNAEKTVYHRFQKEALNLAKETVKNAIEKLENLEKDGIELQNYKYLSCINEELELYWDNPKDLFRGLVQQLNLAHFSSPPRINEYLVYANEDILFPITSKLPYNNPKLETLTEEQKELVDNFFNIFLDPLDKSILSCYLGACLLNMDIHNEYVSKMLIITSNGENGKYSLITELIDALFTPDFRDIKSSFDKCFSNNSRFKELELSIKRICIYMEGLFYKAKKGRTRKISPDFEGLDIGDIKSLITEGIVTEHRVAKYYDTKLNGFQIILSNHLPKIPKCHEGLRRRILAITIKSSEMDEKFQQLGLIGNDELRKFLEKNVQALANYCVSAFLENKDVLRKTNYDKDKLQETSEMKEEKKIKTPEDELVMN